MGSACPQDTLLELLCGVRALAEYQRATGVGEVPRRNRARREAPARCAARPEPVSKEGVTGHGGEEQPRVIRAVGPVADLFAAPGLARTGSLDELRSWIGDCRRCKLCGSRTNLVFGVGNASADLMFVGEGPGRDEDLQGEPFVGRAGRLLTEIISKGMKLRREDVYIANVIKCRPPGNRNPESDEISSCLPFLVRQVELIRPSVIVALGTFAAQAVLGVKTPISRMRGTWHEFHGVKVMPTFHPAYLLRSPGEKKTVWHDIKMVMRELGLRS